MQLVVEATSVAHGFAVLIPSPQGGGGSLAVCAGGSFSSCRALRKNSFLTHAAVRNVA